MDISRRVREDVSIIDLSGRLAAASSAALQQIVQGEIRNGKRNILLNLHGLTWMDSSGLGELTAAKGTAARSGANLKLLNVDGRVREVMVMANAINDFAVFDHESTAVASFR